MLHWSWRRPDVYRFVASRPVRWIPLVLLLAIAGCSGDSPSDTSTGPVVIRGEEETTEPGATASSSPPQTQAGQPPADPQQPLDISQASIDSVVAQLRDITAAQQVILSRLDSMEGTRADAAQADSGATGGAVLDLEEARDEVRSLGVNIFWSLAVLLVFSFLIRTLIWILETLAERSLARRLTYKRLVPVTRMLLWGIAGYLIVRTVFRVDAQGVLAASAALGLALGIAAQDLLKNVFGGLIVVFDQPFQVGDKISLGGTYGEVVSIGLRSTRIVTPDDSLVSVPNSQVVEKQVANANAGQLNCQVVTDLYLPGRIDERKAKAIAFEAAVTSQYVFLNKPIVVLVGDEFRTTFVTHIKVKAYVFDTRFEFLMRSDITERARDGFRAGGLVAEHDWYPRVGTPYGASGTDGETVQ